MKSNRHQSPLSKNPYCPLNYLKRNAPSTKNWPIPRIALGNALSNGTWSTRMHKSALMPCPRLPNPRENNSHRGRYLPTNAEKPVGRFAAINARELGKSAPGCSASALNSGLKTKLYELIAKLIDVYQKMPAALRILPLKGLLQRDGTLLGLAHHNDLLIEF